MITKSTKPPTDDDRYLAWVAKYRPLQRAGILDRITEAKPKANVVHFRMARK